ncbi:MAG: ParB/Srx family N-terminal domain-containing protein [Rhizorhabdus sp.]
MPVSALRPNSRNARTHSKRQVKQIAGSIERFGFTNPVLIGDDDEIIAGHGRVAAARQLGLSEVPTLRLSHLSADERRAYVLPTTSSRSMPAGTRSFSLSSCRR